MSMSTVRDNPDLHRYEIDDGGELAAFTEYRLHGSVADFVHTETLAGHDGRGLGSQLVRGALEDARRRSWQVRPFCPFVRAYIDRHREFVDLVPDRERARFQLESSSDTPS
jgi:predicted GNAT family acetyltransferase